MSPEFFAFIAGMLFAYSMSGISGLFRSVERKMMTDQLTRLVHESISALKIVLKGEDFSDDDDDGDGDGPYPAPTGPSGTSRSRFPEPSNN